MEQPGDVVDEVASLLERAASSHASTGRTALARLLRKQARRLRVDGWEDLAER